MTPTKAEIEADNEARTTSLGLFGYACEYFAVAIAANERLGADQRRFGIALMPVNFLIGQSLELALKAYLREAGATLMDMRNWGHDLVVLLDEAVAKGLMVNWTATDRTLIALLNEQYRPREFQHAKTGAKTFPQIDPLSETVANLLETVADQVPSADGFLRGNRVGACVLEVLKK